MGIKDSLRNSLKNGLVGLLVGASVIGNISGCYDRHERERQDYSRESQEELNEDLLVITYDEWKNNDRLKEHAQYILKHPDEAYERLDEEGKRGYDEVISYLEEFKEFTNSLNFAESEEEWKKALENEKNGGRNFFNNRIQKYGLTKFRNPKLSTVLNSSFGERIIGAIELGYIIKQAREEDPLLKNNYPEGDPLFKDYQTP